MPTSRTPRIGHVAAAIASYLLVFVGLPALWVLGMARHAGAI